MISVANQVFGFDRMSSPSCPIMCMNPIAAMIDGITNGIVKVILSATRRAICIDQVAKQSVCLLPM